MNTSPSSPEPTFPASQTSLSSHRTQTFVSKLPHPRSCHQCRRRKVKCNRQQPCSNCTSAANCVYPPGPGRAAKRPRHALDAQLLDRLGRLESIMKRLEMEKQDQLQLEDQPVAGKPIPPGQPFAQASSTASPSIDHQIGRLMIDESRSFYVGNSLWTSLGNEIEELRDLLSEPVCEDANYVATETALFVPEHEHAGPLGSNAAIFGLRSTAHSLRSLHPPLSMSVALLQIFRENVVPLVHIFHVPTTTRMYWDAIASLDAVDAVDKNTEALLFAIYYSAVISMEPGQCMATLGVSRVAALEKDRFAVEQAMSRADLLNTQSIILLQGAVLFLTALGNEDDSRTAWSLTSLVFHIAQAMGLHRDGTAFGLRPLETELRRRIWYYVCLLDVRSSESHGYEPIVHESAFDTKLPLHVNDSDLTPEMTVPPSERDTVTEMTFFLIRCESLRAGCWKAASSLPTTQLPGRASSAHEEDGDGSNPLTTREAREALVENLKKRLQDRYLRHCGDTSEPFMLVVSTVARLILARTWLKAHYPQGLKDDLVAHLDSDMRDRLFQISIEILELSNLLLSHKDIAKWAWHSQTHIQWHAVALVLSEICTRPPSRDCDRAWAQVTAIYERWKKKHNEKRGIMWRPIKRLLAKAGYVREMQKIEPPSVSPVEKGQETLNTPTSSIANPSTSARAADGEPFSTMGALPGVRGTNPLYPLMDMDMYLHNTQAVPDPGSVEMESIGTLMGMFPDDSMEEILGTVTDDDGYFDVTAMYSWAPAL
ncbi:fungal-specific transcription factor domain-containing protein [Cercophora scortea]|uniref:Fungal-specific transcription factor domain-containing protein n=1 Tax=Cercophora scortea TaxID=314031 RepID=A0AAE0MID9_9PEZI|nr:fungal-specific transcription factor domain-containing protein [Cercophora scortea]